MTKLILDYLCTVEGWLTAIKNIHWNADNMSQHKLSEDIAGRIQDFQDRVAEVEQSITGNLPFNKLQAKPYKAKNLKTLVQDVLSHSSDVYKKVEKMGDTYTGMASDFESFLSDMQQNLYLVNFTMKEDLERRLKNRINEDVYEVEIKGHKTRLTESELHNFIREAVMRTVEA